MIRMEKRSHASFLSFCSPTVAFDMFFKFARCVDVVGFCLTVLKSPFVQIGIISVILQLSSLY